MISKDLRDEIRSIVRGAIRDLGPQLAAAKAATAGSDPASKGLGERISEVARGGGGQVAIRIASDADLQAFAALFITCPDPVAQAAVLEGKVRLVLDKGTPPSVPTSQGAGPRQSVGAVIESGLLNERKVSEIAKNHKAVVLSEGVVVTPLAYDRARACGLEIVRKRK